jgi:hypothetical protein
MCWIYNISWITEVETKAWYQAPQVVVEAYSKLCNFLEALDFEGPEGLDYIHRTKSFNQLLSCFYLPGTGMNVCGFQPSLVKKRSEFDN